MNVRPERESCSELRDEIRQLEVELKAIDRQLGKVSTRVQLGAFSDADADAGPDDFSGPEDAWLAAATRERAEQVQDDADLSAQLRSGLAGAAAAPYRKVEFSEGKRSLSERVDSRFLRWLGMAVVVGGILAIWLIVIRPVLRSEHVNTDSPEMDAFTAQLEADFNQAEEALHEFYQAASVQSVLASVRSAKALEPVIRAYYHENPLTPREVEVSALERVRHLDETFVLAMVRHAELPGRQVAVELSGNGPRVDWELATNAQKKAWEVLPSVQEVSTMRPFRIALESADYYNRVFDEQHWVCFQVSAPEADKPAYAYAPRQSELAQRLQGVLEFEEPHPAQVVAAFAPGGKSDGVRQLRIVELIAEQWLLPAETLPLRGDVQGEGLISYN